MWIRLKERMREFIPKMAGVMHVEKNGL